MTGQDREGGAFFFNNKKQGSQPDYRGELRVTPELVMALQEQLQRGVQFPAIELAGWKKTSNNGQTFISMKGQKPYEKNSGAGQSSGQVNQGGGQWPAQGQGYGTASQGGYGAPAGAAGIPDDEIPL
jgi:hypothetical protein